MTDGEIRKAKFALANRILLDKSRPPAHRLVGWYIVDHINTKRGYAWCSQEDIARELGICERAVRYAIKILAPYFVIDRSQRQHEYRMRTPANYAAEPDDTGKKRHRYRQSTTSIPAHDVPPSFLYPLNHPIRAVADATRTDSKPKKEGKGNSRKEGLDASSVSTSFNEFWKAKPSRGRAANPKHHARLKFETVVKAGADPQQIIAAAKQWASVEAENKNIGTTYVAMAATWLHQRRFEDYQAAPTAAEQSGFTALPQKPAVQGMARSYQGQRSACVSTATGTAPARG